MDTIDIRFIGGPLDGNTIEVPLSAITLIPGDGSDEAAPTNPNYLFEQEIRSETTWGFAPFSSDEAGGGAYVSYLAVYRTAAIDELHFHGWQWQRVTPQEPPEWYQRSKGNPNNEWQVDESFFDKRGAPFPLASVN